MPGTDEKFERLQRQAEGLRREQARAEGAAQNILRTLREEYGLDSLDAAKDHARKLRQQAAKFERLFADELEAFEQQWGAKDDDGDADGG